MYSNWQALSREAGLAAEHLAIGVTAIGKANYSQPAHYYQAFFALSIGLERAAKLALVVDHAIDHNGTFPSYDELKNRGHNIKELLDCLEKIVEKRNLSEATGKFPASAIHAGIIETLSNFASNITRYYNFDFVTGFPKAAQRSDPITEWFEKVTLPVHSEYYKPHHKKRDEHNARLIDQLIAGNTFVFYHDERNNELNSVYDASKQSAITEFTIPYTRMYIMQIIRFVAYLLDMLGVVVSNQGIQNIPPLSGYFNIFKNSDDMYFKNRKGWSIYTS